ncbi:uncharacterized protein LOC143421685 [Maylandia zebra]|uniref:uncharacterized protein LOC143421685 n=1 Tax=Maylandia zebra TaxID=106582 RepID=UPI00403C8C03
MRHSEVYLLVTAAALVVLCCGWDISCSVTEDAYGTLYTVPDFQATRCIYSWMNSTGHVLVNNNETVTGLVTNSSIRTLLTRACLKQVNYSRDCVSEGIQHTTSCFTGCSGTTNPQKSEGTPSHCWNTFITVFIMVLQLQCLSATS